MPDDVPDAMPDAIRVLICGGRDYQDRDALYAALDRLHANRSFAIVIDLFGPQATAKKGRTLLFFDLVGNQYKGHSITLYAVPRGNFQTDCIPLSEF